MSPREALFAAVVSVHQEDSGVQYHVVYMACFRYETSGVFHFRALLLPLRTCYIIC
jgi:hypothetical protein